MVSGGANLIIFPWVGFASNPLSFKACQISSAVELKGESLTTNAFKRPLPLTLFKRSLF